MLCLVKKNEETLRARIDTFISVGTAFKGDVVFTEARDRWSCTGKYLCDTGSASNTGYQ